MPVAPGTSMPLATEVSFEIDISFNSERLKISSFPSRLGAASAGGSAVATPPPLSPLPLLLVRLLFAISLLSCAASAARLWLFVRVLIIQRYLSKEVLCGVFRRLMWGPPAASTNSSQPLRQRSESTKSRGRSSWMPVDGDCVDRKSTRLN